MWYTEGNWSGCYTLEEDDDGLYIGDLNNDNELNILDLIFIVNIILNNEQDSQFDLNQDGDINIIDIISLVNLILGDSSQRISSIDSVEIQYTNNLILIESDRAIAGLEISIKGDIYILATNLNNSDWIIEFKNNKIIIVDHQGTTFDNSIQIDYVGEIFDLDAIVCGWDNQAIITKGIYKPSEIVLSKAYPNPFNPSTNFTVELDERSLINISIYTISGQLIESIFEDYLSGKQTFTWNANVYSSGIYLIKLNAENRVITQKIMLIK